MNKFVKTLYKMRYLPLLLVPLLVVMMVLPATLVAYGPTVDLGTTASFAVLAATPNITNIGAGTTIIGDVGLSPATGAGITGLLSTQVTGTIYTVDGFGPAGNVMNPGLLTQAKLDLVTAYNDAAGRANTATVPVELGGTTLTSGVYNTGGVLQITGTLTLDAQGDPNAVFIFKSTATLITADGSNVSLINGARFCRVFWVVPTAATLGTNSHFVGHIFAYAEAITLGSGATVEGQLMTREAAVTLINNTITNGPCETFAAAGGILTIFKVDSSGNPIVAYTPALAAAFKIYANSADIGVNPPVQAGSIIQDTNFFRVSLQNGTYYVVETSAPEGYSGDSTVRTVTMSGGDATLTFVNSPTGKSASRRATETTIAPTETTPAPVTTTVTGGQIPKTSTPWYNVLIAGAALILIGAMGWWITRKVHV